MLTDDRGRAPRSPPVERQQQGLAALLAIARAAAETAPMRVITLRPRPILVPLVTPGPPPRRSLGQRLATFPWLLLPILAAQAYVAVRLIWSNTAFSDEALYLWSGHLQMESWLHGVSIPPFATYFSGAPVLYPVVGAVADSVAGLAGARILSLGFMLGATALLWAVTSRLFGGRAGLFAAGLWVFLAPTMHLSAFATYDPMATFLLALAAWFAVQPAGRLDETRNMALAALSLAAANATAYSTAIFDPVLVIAALLTAYPKPGGKYAWMRAMSLMGSAATAVIVLITAGGGYYMTGIGQTILARRYGTDAPLLVLSRAWLWIGPVLAVAGGAVLLALWRESEIHRKLLIVLFAAAGLLVPLQQARIHTLTSLDKHADVGAWFAAITVGYAAETLITIQRPRLVRATLTLTGAVALALPVPSALIQAKQLYSWPDAAAFISSFSRLAASHRGRLLVEDPSLGEYYLRQGMDWRRWSNTRSIILSSGRSISVPVSGNGNPLTYERFAAHGYFSLIALNFSGTPALDYPLARYLEASHRYKVIARVPYGSHATYVIWQRIR